MSRLIILLAIFFILRSSNVADAMIEGLYCGKLNCYDVLEVTRDSSKNEISKNYRQLAKKYHPDMHRDPTAKEEAAELFKQIATAYEILKDPDSRADYDYMLDNPDMMYTHYYRYYRRRVAPKVDVRIVIAVSITIISAIQYFSACQRYESAIKYLLTVPKYRNKALDTAKQDGLWDSMKKNRKKTKAEIKEEEEMIIRKVLEDNMDIRGGYAKPSLYDILWVQLVILPYTVTMYIAWNLNWIYKFNIKQEPYGAEEKEYLIRKNMKMGQQQYDALEEEEKLQYLKSELWIRSKFLVWQKQKEEDMKKQLAESSRYKAYRRYLKNHGTGRITFED